MQNFAPRCLGLHRGAFPQHGATLWENFFPAILLAGVCGCLPAAGNSRAIYRSFPGKVQFKAQNRHVCQFSLLNFLKIRKLVNGRSDKIRTCDLMLPKHALYQAEPHSAHKRNIGSRKYARGASFTQQANSPSSLQRS
jgi:hypothetical protein